MNLTPGIDAKALNPATRPQDDLFRHVNGKWLDTTEIPEDKARIWNGGPKGNQKSLTLAYWKKVKANL